MLSFARYCHVLATIIPPLAQESICTMTEIWTDLLKILAGYGILVGGLVYLAKIALKQILTRDITEHRSHLEKESAIEIERLRADLKTVALEHEIRFSKLHEKRGEIIEGLHKKLLRAQAAVTFYLSPLGYSTDPPDAERQKQAELAANDFYTYYRENKLYFDLHLCRLLEDFDAVLTEAQIDSDAHTDNEETSSGERRSSQYAAWKNMKAKIPPILREIEQEFGTLLGISPTSS